MRDRYEIELPQPMLEIVEIHPQPREISDEDAIVLRITHCEILPILPGREIPRQDN